MRATVKLPGPLEVVFRKRAEKARLLHDARIKIFREKREEIGECDNRTFAKALVPLCRVRWTTLVMYFREGLTDKERAELKIRGNNARYANTDGSRRRALSSTKPSNRACNGRVLVSEKKGEYLLALYHLKQQRKVAHTVKNLAEYVGDTPKNVSMFLDQQPDLIRLLTTKFDHAKLSPQMRRVLEVS